MTYHEFKIKLYEKLKKQKIEIKNEQIIDSYFIFEYEQNSIIHFYIQGLKKWKFGMWIGYYENKNISKIQIFTQHKDCIDKFKPSRSAFLYEKEFKDDSSIETLYMFELCDMINMIKATPVLSLLIECGIDSHFYANPFTRYRYYLGCVFSNKKYIIKKWYKNRTKYINIDYLRCLGLKLICDIFFKDILSNNEIRDMNSNDFIINPRWNFIARWNTKEDCYLEPIIFLNTKWNGENRYYKNISIDLTNQNEYRGYIYKITDEEIVKIRGWKCKVYRYILNRKKG